MPISKGRQMLYRNRRISPSKRPIAFNSAESSRCFDTRNKSLSASASICDVETLRVLPIVDKRILMQTVFLARSTPGSWTTTYDHLKNPVHGQEHVRRPI